MRVAPHSAWGILGLALALACSGESGKKGGHATAPAKTAPPPAAIPATNALAQPAPKKGYNPPRLLQNENGIAFEILELDANPYEGKIVTYHDAEQRIVKEERQYANGRLQVMREFWPNAQLKQEVTYAATGATTNQVTPEGKPIAAAAATNAAPAQGRQYAWTTGGGQAPIESYYANRPTNVLLRAFGPPDAILGNAWEYRNMNITDARTRQPRTTVRFLLNAVVTTVVVE